MHKSTLPPSYLPKEHALDRLRGAIYGTSLRELPTVATQVLNPKETPQRLLDTLAHFYSVDFYRRDFTQSEKREVIASSIELKRLKGTIGAVTKALSNLGLGVEIAEWYSYGGEPFRFKLDIDSGSREITQELSDLVYEMTQEYKNARSVIEEILLSYRVETKQNIKLGGVGEVRCSTEVLEGYVAEIPLQQRVRVGAVAEAQYTATMEVA